MNIRLKPFPVRLAIGVVVAGVVFIGLTFIALIVYLLEPATYLELGTSIGETVQAYALGLVVALIIWTILVPLARSKPWATMVGVLTAVPAVTVVARSAFGGALLDQDGKIAVVIYAFVVGGALGWLFGSGKEQNDREGLEM